MTRSLGRGAVLLLAVFVLVTLLAELLRATNLGTALTFGTIAFMATALALMIRSGRRG